MKYSPDQRGPHPVGVKSEIWADNSRDRNLPVMIWYPARKDYQGKDLNPEFQDRFVPQWLAVIDPDTEAATQTAVRDAIPAKINTPLVLSVHGWAGFKEEATFVGTHLASHGYTVVSPDVIGSTYADVDAFFTSQEPLGEAQALENHLSGICDLRRYDIPFLIDMAAEKLNVDASAVGITGASFGGWTSLGAPEWDERIAASVPQCPGGGRSFVLPTNRNVLHHHLNFNWKKPVPTLMVVADRDSLLPLDGQLDLLRQIPSEEKSMVILADADHNHFVDDIDAGQQWLKEYVERIARIYPNGPGNWPLAVGLVVPQEELCPGAHAHFALRSLILAHMDAHIRGVQDAAAFLNGPIDAFMADHGVATNTLSNCPVHQTDSEGKRQLRVF